MSLNNITLVGNLGTEPELRTTSGGKQMCRLRLATRRLRGDEVDWHDVVVWDVQAVRCKEHLRRGSLVGVQGRLQYRSWDAEDGKRRKVASVVATSVAFLGSRDGGEDTERRRAFSAGGISQEGTEGQALPF